MCASVQEALLLFWSIYFAFSLSFFRVLIDDDFSRVQSSLGNNDEAIHDAVLNCNFGSALAVR